MGLRIILQLLLSGLAIGCAYSLVGLGYSMQVRAVRMINFSQGALVSLGSLIGFTLLRTLQLPFPAVIVLTMVLTGSVGIVLERGMFHPILKRKSPMLYVTVATLGLSMVLQVVELIIWGAEPLIYPPVLGTEPVSFAGLRMDSRSLWIFGTGIGLMIGLQFFFQKTMIGISWRAAALDPDTAALYGVSRRRNVALTFALSSALGGVGGVLLAPLYFASYFLGATVLLKAFAAAAVGGFTVVGTLIAGLAMGTLETFTAALISSEYKHAILYAALLATLLFFFRAKAPAGRTVADPPKIAAAFEIPAAFKRFRRWRVLLWVTGLAILLILPFLLAPYHLHILDLALIQVIAALGLQVIVGYTGQLSFAQAAFYGVGAYASALLALRLGLPFWLTLPLAGLAAGIAGLVMAPILRLEALWLGMATLALGEIAHTLMLNLEGLTGGAFGLMNIPPPKIGPLQLNTDTSYYYLICAILIVGYWLLTRFTRGRFGRALIAVRENELAAAHSGVNVFGYKSLAFLIGCAWAGLAGALYAHWTHYIQPDAFATPVSFGMLTAVVIGGLGTIPGAVLGGLVVALTPELLRVLNQYRIVFYGGSLILFTVFLPGGLREILGRVISFLFNVIGALRQSSSPRGE
jgi:branched-chain amino acid transport system permease protein